MKPKLEELERYQEQAKQHKKVLDNNCERLNNVQNELYKKDTQISELVMTNRELESKMESIKRDRDQLQQDLDSMASMYDQNVLLQTIESALLEGNDFGLKTSARIHIGKIPEDIVSGEYDLHHLNKNSEFQSKVSLHDDRAIAIQGTVKEAIV